MMKIPNHKMWMDVDIEMIGQHWKEVMQVKLNLLTRREVFGPIVETPKGVKPVGFKLVFARKYNENNEIIRYKT